MKKTIIIAAFALCSIAGWSQKMDSDGVTLRNSGNSAIGRIDGSDIRNSSNSQVGRIDSDGKTIRNSSNSVVLVIDGNDIRDSGNSKIASMSDVTNAIEGSKAEAKYVALWWFFIKNDN